MTFKRYFFAILSFHILTHQLYSSSTNNNLSSELDKYMKIFNVPGAAIAIVHKDGTVLKYCNGYRNLEEKLEVTTETLFPIGSSTKPFTSFLLAKYIDKGLFHWDTPLSELLEDFSLSDRYLKENLTVRDAISHQSGFPRYDGIWINRNLSRTELKRLLNFIPPLYKYREDFIYQNNIFMLGGLALEEKIGRPFEDLMEEEILNPLQMNSTSLTIDKFLESTDRATGYENNKKTQLIDLTAIAPAAAINSNLDDMCKWAALLIAKGGDHISVEQWHELTSFHISSSIFSSHQFIDQFIQSEAYGLGWYLLDFRNQEIIMHSGHVEGFSSNVAILPSHDAAIVILSNANGSVFPYVMTARAIEMITGLDPIVLDKEISTLIQVHDDKFKTIIDENIKKPQTNNLVDYTGTYSDLAFGEIHVYLKNKKLYLSFHDYEFSLKHNILNTFSIENNNAPVCFNNMKILFNLDFSGNVASITMDLPTDDSVLTFKKNLLELTVDDIEAYIGNYNYNGWEIKILKTEHGLEALLQNYYSFPLIPETRTRFIIPSYEGYIIEFKEDKEDPGSLNVALISPQNEVYLGKRVKN